MLYKLFKYMPKAVRRLIERPFLISWAIVDPKWFWFFNDWKNMLKNLKNTIKEKEINNIFLDWI